MSWKFKKTHFENMYRLKYKKKIIIRLWESTTEIIKENGRLTYHSTDECLL